MPVENNKKSTSETGHFRILESFNQLIAAGALLDQERLNPPDDLTVAAMQTVSDDAAARHAKVGNSRADWRTAALSDTEVFDAFETLASQAVNQLRFACKRLRFACGRMRFDNFCQFLAFFGVSAEIFWKKMYNVDKKVKIRRI